MAIQDKFNKTNHIYKITKDIDLGGATLNIPAGCTLDFQGGSFSNGIINFNNTTVLNGSMQNCTFSGVVSNTIYLSRFTKSDDNIADFINWVTSKSSNRLVIDKNITIDKPINILYKTDIDCLNNTITVDDSFTGDVLFKCYNSSNSANAIVNIRNAIINFNGTIGSDSCPICFEFEYLLRGTKFENIEIRSWDNTVFKCGYKNYSDVSEAINFYKLTINSSSRSNKNFPLMDLKRLHESNFNMCRFFNSSNFGDSTTFGDSTDGSVLIKMKNCNNITFDNCFFGAQKGKIFEVTTDANKLSNGINIINSTFEQCLTSGDEPMMYFQAENTSNSGCSVNIMNNRYNYPFQKGFIYLHNVLGSNIIFLPLNYKFNYGSEGNNIINTEIQNPSFIGDGNSKNTIKILCRNGGIKYLFNSSYKEDSIHTNSYSMKYSNGTNSAGVVLCNPSNKNGEIQLVINDQTVETFNLLGLIPKTYESSNRPQYSTNTSKGKCIFDTTLNKPIWWTGTKWVDATGADV